MRHYLLAGVAFGFGLVAGTYLSRPKVVHAQAQSVVYVTNVKSGRGSKISKVPGEIVGFSCTGFNGLPDCYVLSR